MQKIRTLALLLSAVMLCSTLASCNNNSTVTDDITSEYTLDTPPPDTAEETVAEEETNNYVNADFSVPGGFCWEDTQLTLVPEGPGDLSSVKITYTLNGDEPTFQDTVYSEPIDLFASADSVCVRAACYTSQGELLGRIKTNTYIKTQPGRFTTPVVSIVSDNEFLYNEDSGIITHPTMSGKEWERPCHVEFFTSSGEEMVSQDAGLRLFGGSTRTLYQKSFRLVARKTGYYDEMKYNGSGSFDYPFFENRAVIAGANAGQLLERYDRLVLRNGGNDSLQHISQDSDSPTLTRDYSANMFALKYAPDVPAQSSKFVTVYLNGQYYGILDMKEDINDDYFANLYGIEDKNAVTVVKSELDTTRKCEKHEDPLECRFCGTWFYYEVDNGDENALSELDEIYNMISGATLDTYADVYAQLGQKLDIENFMQYTALNLFICNTDWPHNNVRLWKYSGEPIEGNEYTDGKWRFTMRDTDFAFGRYSSGDNPELYTLADTDNFNFTLGAFYGDYNYFADYGDPLYTKSILNFCLKNSEFKTAFEKYCLSLVSDEAINDLTEIMKSAKAEIKSEIPYHITRWADTLSRNMNNRKWDKACNNMQKWIQPRKQSFSEYLSECLSNY